MLCTSALMHIITRRCLVEYNKTGLDLAGAMSCLCNWKFNCLVEAKDKSSFLNVKQGTLTLSYVVSRSFVATNCNHWLIFFGLIHILHSVSC